jgi:hypothetical protein
VTVQDTSFAIAVKGLFIGGLDLQTQKSELNFSRGSSLDNGTGSGQVDIIWSDTRTIAASGTDDLDLTGTALQTAFGANLAFVKVKVIAVYASALNTNNVVIGGAAATQFVGPFGAAAHTIALPPTGLFLVAAPLLGWSSVAATSDLLRIANSGAGTSVTYDIAVLGTSA